MYVTIVFSIYTTHIHFTYRISIGDIVSVKVNYIHGYLHIYTVAWPYIHKVV